MFLSLMRANSLRFRFRITNYISRSFLFMIFTCGSTAEKLQRVGRKE